MLVGCTKYQYESTDYNNALGFVNPRYRHSGVFFVVVVFSGHCRATCKVIQPLQLNDKTE